jgi:hypothetical protein
MLSKGGFWQPYEATPGWPLKTTDEDLGASVLAAAAAASSAAAPGHDHAWPSAGASAGTSAGLPFDAIGTVDVSTGESSIFMLNNTRYLLDNIFCGYMDHAGKWNPAFTNHSYARIRQFETGKLVANVTATIGTSFVSAFVDHLPSGDILWLSALNEDRCHQQCGHGVLAISSTDLVTFTSKDIGFKGSTCNTEVAKVPVSPKTLPPHKYVMILEPFTFLVNNNADGDLTHGWVPAGPKSKSPHAPGGGPSIRFEAGYYFVITGGQTVMLCRSKDLGASDPWDCKVMIAPPYHHSKAAGGGVPTVGPNVGTGDAKVAPYAGFPANAARKNFPVLEKDLSGWDWNSNDADVCCTGGSTPAFIIWGASTQGGKSALPPGSPSSVNALGRRNSTLAELLTAFFV